MQRKWRRYWPIVGVAIAASIVAGTYWELERRSREPPNYTRIEEGLWLGGLVREPPPGTQAVLNLCESEDPYRAELHSWVPIPDSEPAPSLDWLREQVGFVESARAKGLVVYVHCRAGISRSGIDAAREVVPRRGVGVHSNETSGCEAEPGIHATLTGMGTYAQGVMR
jgi:hypothetical protein